MKKVLFTVFIISILASCKHEQKTTAFKTIHNEKTDRLDSLYTAYYNKGELNGNVLIAENGEIIFQKSFGLANEETKEKLNLETSFELASVSKQFTAMGIVQLQKEGKLSYKDPISNFIPELDNYEGVTIKNLLTHTGGLPDYMYLLDQEWDKTKFATNESVIELFKELQPEKEFEPGEDFRYSNTGYLLLASIIERLSGKSFEAYLTEKIFNPLQMDHTFVYRRRFQPKEVENYAYGYIYSDSLKRKILPDEIGNDFYIVFLDGIVGDGMVSSNLHDLLKWDKALYGNTLINEEDRKLIFSSYPIKGNQETDYGFGWFIKQDSLLGKVASHSGRWAGYLTLIERHLDKDKTIIQLFNNETKITSNPIENVHKVLYNLPIEKPYELPVKTLNKYVGSYTADGRTEKINIEFNRLWIGGIYPLKPVSETKFIIDGFRPEVSYEFLLDTNGEVEKIKVQQLEQGIDYTAVLEK